jgi:hypothetical protein
VQVTQKIEQTNYNREVEGLLEAMQRLELSEGLILTEETKDEMLIDGKKILIQPIWFWLLNN